MSRYSEGPSAGRGRKRWGDAGSQPGEPASVFRDASAASASAAGPRNQNLEYIRQLQERNRQLKKVTEEERQKRKEGVEREAGFSLYFQGANRGTGPMAGAASSSAIRRPRGGAMAERTAPEIASTARLRSVPGDSVSAADLSEEGVSPGPVARRKGWNRQAIVDGAVSETGAGQRGGGIRLGEENRSEDLEVGPSGQRQKMSSAADYEDEEFEDLFEEIGQEAAVRSLTMEDAKLLRQSLDLIAGSTPAAGPAQSRPSGQSAHEDNGLASDVLLVSSSSSSSSSSALSNSHSTFFASGHERRQYLVRPGSAVALPVAVAALHLSRDASAVSAGAGSSTGSLTQQQHPPRYSSSSSTTSTSSTSFSHLLPSSSLKNRPSSALAKERRPLPFFLSHADSVDGGREPTVGGNDRAGSTVDGSFPLPGSSGPDQPSSQQPAQRNSSFEITAPSRSESEASTRGPHSVSAPASPRAPSSQEPATATASPRPGPKMLPLPASREESSETANMDLSTSAQADSVSSLVQRILSLHPSKFRYVMGILDDLERTSDPGSEEAQLSLLRQSLAMLDKAAREENIPKPAADDSSKKQSADADAGTGARADDSMDEFPLPPPGARARSTSSSADRQAAAVPASWLFESPVAPSRSAATATATATADAVGKQQTHGRRATQKCGGDEAPPPVALGETAGGRLSDALADSAVVARWPQRSRAADMRASRSLLPPLPPATLPALPAGTFPADESASVADHMTAGAPDAARFWWSSLSQDNSTAVAAACGSADVSLSSAPVAPDASHLLPESEKPVRSVAAVLPCTQSLHFKILSTWGDCHYVGLTGIEVFDAAGNLVPVESIRADPADINVLPEYEGDPRVVANLIDGHNQTTDDFHMWLAPFWPGRVNDLWIVFRETVAISMIRVWNYNKSRVHSTRGVRHMEIESSASGGGVIFSGEIRQAPGEVPLDVLSNPLEDFSESILFTVDRGILDRIQENDESLTRSLDAELNEMQALLESGLDQHRPGTSSGLLSGAAALVFCERSAASPDTQPLSPFHPVLEQLPKAALLPSAPAVPEPPLPRSAVGGGINSSSDVRKLVIQILDSWGDPYFVGLSGFQLFDDNDRLLPPSAMSVSARPRDMNDIPGHHGDPRVLENLTRGPFLTTDDSFMWLVPLQLLSQEKTPEYPTISIEFLSPNPAKISRIRLYNYNKNAEDTCRGVRRFRVFLDGCLAMAAAPGASDLWLRRGTGHCDVDFGHDVFLSASGVSFVRDGIGAGAGSTARPWSIYQPMVREALSRSACQPIHHSLLPSLEFLTPLYPVGLTLRIRLLRSFGDIHYVGLNGMEIYDALLRPIPLQQQSCSGCTCTALPCEDLNCVALDGAKSGRGTAVRSPDCRVIGNLFDGVNVTREDCHIWLTAFPHPGAVTDSYVDVLLMFPEPVAIGMIRIWNYAKTPSRGAFEMEMYLDESLVYRGLLMPAPPVATEPLGDFATVVLFSNDHALLRKEKAALLSQSHSVNQLGEMLLLFNNMQAVEDDAASGHVPGLKRLPVLRGATKGVASGSAGGTMGPESAADGSSKPRASSARDVLRRGIAQDPAFRPSTSNVREVA